ncbi:SNAP25 ous protein snap33 [Ancistrocladus abbreviatus]
MVGSKKSPIHRYVKHSSVDSATPNKMSSNPFDSNDESDNKHTLTSSKRASSEPIPNIPNSTTNPFDDDYGEIRETSSASKYTFSYAQRNKYKIDFRDAGGLQNQSVQELENYAVYKSEETTKTVNNLLKIGMEMRDDATKTLITLHQQGEQITRTHQAAADIDLDLSRGEKLLGSLGGIFSKTWKPKKTRPIRGPVIARDDPATRRGGHLEQREKLGLAPPPNGRPKSQTPPPEPIDAFQKVEVEKAKQDDALSDLSDVLAELKGMAIDMGSEIERQNKALDPFCDEVDELNFRVKNANQRTRRLLGK